MKKDVDNKENEEEACSYKQTDHVSTVNSTLAECSYILDKIESENYTGRWESNFIELYEQALLNSLWEKGIIDRDEYEWCQQELKLRK